MKVTYVTMSSVSDVLTAQQITELKKLLNRKGFELEKKECHYNSGNIALCLQRMGLDAGICQGYIPYIDGLPEDGTLLNTCGHSWNYVNINGRTSYIDLTFEWLLNEDVADTPYPMLIKGTTDEITGIFDQEGYAFIIFQGDYKDGEYFYYDEKLVRHTLTKEAYMALYGFKSK